MSMSIDFGVYTKNNELLKSFNDYNKAIEYIRSLKGIKHINVQYLFKDKETKINLTNILYIQKYFENGGGIERFGNKYYYNKEK